MITIDNIDSCRIGKSAVALGKFDGVHLGHRTIIEELKKNTDKDTKTVVITFSVSPEAVLSGKNMKYIMTDREKQEYFEELDIEYLIDIKLNKEFLHMTAEDFVKKYLVERLGVVKVVCGRDFRFGRGRAGDMNYLCEAGKRYGFETKIISHVSVGGNEISSTRIRAELLAGNVELANRMLGHAYSVTGIVEHGNELGRKINFPTVNILPSFDKILPPNGVYVSECVIGGTALRGITNIGVKPTVGSQRIGIETNIFDYSGDLYGEMITIRFLKFLRPERKFASLGELQQQIKKDILMAKKIQFSTCEE